MGSIYKRGDKGPWYASYVDHTGKRVRFATGTTDKDAARRILAKAETDAALRRRGVIDAAAERMSVQVLRPIGQHVDEFIAKLEASGRTEKHVTDTRTILEQVIESERWEVAKDIAPEGIERHAATLREQNRANRTIQKHLSTWKQFTAWAYRTDRIPSDVLKSVEAPTPATDRRLIRRALRPEEWPWLKRATIDGGELRGMSAESRAIIYELAIQTGLRQNELRELTKGKFFLDRSPCFVILPAGSTKNRKQARQYVTRDFAVTLAAMLTTVDPTGPVFDLCDESRVAEVVRRDLKSARAQWIESTKDSRERTRREKSDFLRAKNDEGQSFDFHCLRHTCGAWLAMKGENPKTIQTIMRHQSITLTMDTYGHLFPDEASSAIERMGPILTLRV